MRVIRYTKWVENRRNNLRNRIPEALIEASSEKNNKEDVDKSMACLQDYATHPRHKLWVQRLITWIVIKEQTPEKLATLSPLIFARLVKDETLDDILKEMLIADGPSGGNWTEALDIYEEILQTSDKVKHETEEMEHPIRR
mmetsp:Transcript_19964/g.42063  ORF Transcript_19964/g.42063 Transcript_19964/m.42063 type:complete len:141 (+) Transcript_19964:229-651(+)